MSWTIQFTARKRDRVTRERYRWRVVVHDQRDAEREQARLRKHRDYRGKILIEIRRNR